nr:unnamed protein product [Callosobruchus chinensis]
MEVLVRQRGGLKASLTNFNKYSTQIHTIEELSADQVIELESRLNNLENVVLQRFYDVQDKIETSCDENDLENEYNTMVTDQEVMARDQIEKEKSREYEDRQREANEDIDINIGDQEYQKNINKS